MMQVRKHQVMRQFTVYKNQFFAKGTNEF